MRTKEEAMKLFDDNQKLVFHILNKHFKAQDNEVKKDLYQEGSIALYKASQTFDESKGYKFSTYASKAIFYDMLKYKERYLDKHRKYLSYEIENDIGIKIVDTLATEEEYSLIGLNEVLNKVSSMLNEKEKLVLKLRVAGYSQREIAKKIDQSQVNVSRILRKIASIATKVENNEEIVITPKGRPRKVYVDVDKLRCDVKQLYNEGYKYIEISEKLNIPRGSISSYLRVS